MWLGYIEAGARLVDELPGLAMLKEFEGQARVVQRP